MREARELANRRESDGAEEGWIARANDHLVEPLFDSLGTGSTEEESREDAGASSVIWLVLAGVIGLVWWMS